MSGRSKPWCAMPRSTAPMPRHEFSQERSAPSTGRPASTRAASSVTRSRRPSWSVTAGGLAGQHALLDHLVRSEQKLPRPPEAGGPAHERSGQGRGTTGRSLTIERPEGEHREHRTAPSEGKRPRLLAGAAFLVQLALGAVYAWSVFVKPGPSCLCPVLPRCSGELRRLLRRPRSNYSLSQPPDSMWLL